MFQIKCAKDICWFRAFVFKCNSFKHKCALFTIKHSLFKRLDNDIEWERVRHGVISRTWIMRNPCKYGGGCEIDTQWFLHWYFFPGAKLMMLFWVFGVFVCACVCVCSAYLSPWCMPRHIAAYSISDDEESEGIKNGI